MQQSYLLVEGVNIYANVLDTNQLSIIRGTSFLLKDAVDKVTDKFKGQLKAISTGASSGLYLVDSSNNSPANSPKNDNQQLAELIDKVCAFLNTPNKDFSLLSFVVETCEATDLLEAKEKLLTQLRIRQMRSLIAVPDRQYVDDLNRPDQLEGHRVAREGHHYKIQSDTSRYLSDSIFRRWEYGKKKKFNFYFDQKSRDLINAENKDSVLASIKDIGFYNDFEALAKHPDDDHKLNNKLAVIYMDGNSFSKKQRDYIKNAADQVVAQRDFDEKIQGYRANFIFQLLKKYLEQEKSEKIRLETLLWGGDEMLFVVPAWLGFDLLQFFFDQSKNWQLDNKPLTHAAGLVFCHAKTPIANIRTLAQSIADTIKDTPTGREQNAWAYLVLESIDYPSNNNIKDFNQKYYEQVLADSKPALIPAFEGNFDVVKASLEYLIDQQLLSTRQLYKIVYAIKDNQNSIDDAFEKSWDQLVEQRNDDSLRSLHPVEKQEYRLLQLTKDKEALSKHLKEVATLFDMDVNKPKQRLWFWIYLYELWDYLL